MKTLNELRAFCEGYAKGLANDRSFYGTTLEGVDDWVQWGGYDINLFGSYLSVRLEDDTSSLSVDAYPAGWLDVLPDPIHTFDIKGESK
jgi:hypothetical protein